MYREHLGHGCLYLIGMVLGIVMMTRLTWVGVPYWATVVAGVIAGAMIGRFLTKS